MPAAHHEILPGTCEMLILQTLSRSRKLHGLGIADSIEQISEDV